MWRSVSATNEGLISHLKQAGIISSKDVVNAMLAVDRGNFAPSSPYDDAPEGIGFGQTISAPHMHGYAMEALREHITRPGASILDVGCGSGYLCATFAELAPRDAHIYGIDNILGLVQLSERNLNRQNVNYLASKRVTLQCANGWEGLPAHAPFDAIHVGAGAESMPQALVKQLKVGGRMIIPVEGHYGFQDLYQVDRLSEDKVQSTKLMGVTYVPLVKPAKHPY